MTNKMTDSKKKSFPIFTEVTFKLTLKDRIKALFGVKINVSVTVYAKNETDVYGEKTKANISVGKSKKRKDLMYMLNLFYKENNNQ